jgi:hypothetical protein
MIELRECVWQDIEDILEVKHIDTNARGVYRAKLDRVIEMVDMERARQVRQSMSGPIVKPLQSPLPGQRSRAHGTRRSSEG